MICVKARGSRDSCEMEAAKAVKNNVNICHCDLRSCTIRSTSIRKLAKKSLYLHGHLVDFGIRGYLSVLTDLYTLTKHSTSEIAFLPYSNVHRRRDTQFSDVFPYTLVMANPADEINFGISQVIVDRVSSASFFWRKLLV